MSCNVRNPRRHDPMIQSRVAHPSNPAPHTEGQKPCAASRAEQEHPVLLQVLFSYFYPIIQERYLFICVKPVLTTIHDS